MNRRERRAPWWVQAVAGVLLAAAALPAQPICSVDATWRHESGAPVLELDLMVQRGSLEWEREENSAVAGWQARAWLERAGRVVADTSWSRTDRRRLEPALAPGEKVPDQILLAIPPDGGRLRVRVADARTGLLSEKTLRVGKPAAAALGGCFLGVTAPEMATDDGPFLHGAGAARWRFLSYGDAMYGSGLDTLHALVEVLDDGPLDSLELAVALLNERGRRLESGLPRPLAHFPLLDGPVRLVALRQPVGHLPSGAYELEVALYRQGGGAATVGKAFWMHNPAVAPPPPEDEQTALDDASPEELARQWEAAQVLASHYEEEAWGRLDLEGRRAFIKEFWRVRDPDPATPLNEEQAALLDRVEEARRRWPGTGGASSMGDRARVFVRYGPPDAVETDFGQLNARYDFQLGTSSTGTSGEHRDFELWLYHHLEGGAEFIFIDVQGFGTFELAHSTKSGEYFDPQWARKLFP